MLEAPRGLGCLSWQSPSHPSWCRAGLRLWEPHPPSHLAPALPAHVPRRAGPLLLGAGRTPLLYNPGCDCGERLV